MSEAPPASSNNSGRGPVGESLLKQIWLPAVIAILVGVTYWPAVHGAFIWDDVLRDRVQVSLAVMLRFFGLERVVVPPTEDHRDGKVVVVRARDFDRRRAIWLWPDHHNHRRLSRILRSLRLLGHERDARALFACLDDIARTDGRDTVTFETREHWRRESTY